MTSTRAPGWRYHPTEPARIFQTEAELDALSPLWRDRPWATDETPPSADEMAPAPVAELTPVVSPTAAVIPPASAPPRRKNKLVATDTVN